MPVSCCQSKYIGNWDKFLTSDLVLSHGIHYLSYLKFEKVLNMFRRVVNACLSELVQQNLFWVACCCQQYSLTLLRSNTFLKGHLCMLRVESISLETFRITSHKWNLRLMNTRMICLIKNNTLMEVTVSVMQRHILKRKKLIVVSHCFLATSDKHIISFHKFMKQEWLP